jgi:hypothetical protein
MDDEIDQLLDEVHGELALEAKSGYDADPVPWSRFQDKLAYDRVQALGSCTVAIKPVVHTGNDDMDLLARLKRLKEGSGDRGAHHQSNSTQAASNSAATLPAAAVQRQAEQEQASLAALLLQQPVQRLSHEQQVEQLLAQAMEETHQEPSAGDWLAVEAFSSDDDGK